MRQVHPRVLCEEASSSVCMRVCVLLCSGFSQIIFSRYSWHARSYSMYSFALEIDPFNIYIPSCNIWIDRYQDTACCGKTCWLQKYPPVAKIPYKQVFIHNKGTETQQYFHMNSNIL